MGLPLAEPIRMTRNNTSLSKRILHEMGKLIFDFFDDDEVRLPWIYRHSGGMTHELEAYLTYERRQRKLRQALYKMKHAKLLEYQIIGDEMRLSLTDKGAIACLLETIRRAPRAKDGALTLISFDIPERQRKARNEFRRFLKKAGFTQFHQSLWCNEKEVIGPLSELMKKMRTDKWISLYRAHKHDFMGD
jgi:hypothetical protein